MIFKARISQVLCILAVFLFPQLCSSLPKSTKIADNAQFLKDLDRFGLRLYSQLAQSYTTRNIIVSPISIHICLGMVLMGAEGETASEMQRGLSLTEHDSKHLANYYHNIMQQYQQSGVLKIANKIYVNQGSEFQDKYKNLVTKKFLSSVDAINFADGKNAAQIINTWVEDKTNNKIKNLISPDALSANTALVLVNAIHLKADWARKFPKENTRPQDFYLNKDKKFEVEMMHVTGRFKYGEFPGLGATVLEMKYRNSDLSMVIFLPTSHTGLDDLEEKLETNSLADLTRKMRYAEVAVGMPKFKTELDLGLTNILKNMGMKRMFLNAELGKMLKGKPDLQVSEVVHKAVIEVDETGTEAAAATGIITRRLIAPLATSNPKKFTADRPFHFVIKDKMNLPLFKGSIKAKF